MVDGSKSPELIISPTATKIGLAFVIVALLSAAIFLASIDSWPAERATALFGIALSVFLLICAVLLLRRFVFWHRGEISIGPDGVGWHKLVRGPIPWSAIRNIRVVNSSGLPFLANLSLCINLYDPKPWCKGAVGKWWNRPSLRIGKADLLIPLNLSDAKEEDLVGTLRWYLGGASVKAEQT